MEYSLAHLTVLDLSPPRMAAVAARRSDIPTIMTPRLFPATGAEPSLIGWIRGRGQIYARPVSC